MARQDINMDATSGEVNLTDNLTSKTIYPFMPLGELFGMDNDHYCYGEIMVPVDFESMNVDGYEVRLFIPYTPEYKFLKVRFVLDTGNDNRQYVVNRSTNSYWFIVRQEEGDIRLSEYGKLNGNGICTLVLRQGKLYLDSGAESDFIIKPSLIQNKTFLLKSLTGSLYQYPTTGVGLINYLHGNFETSGLSAKLLQEFEADGMIINNAYMNSQTGELVLDVTEKENG